MAVLATLTKSRPRRRSEFGLILVGVLVVLFAYTLAFAGTYNTLPSNLATLALILFGVGIIVNIINRALVPEADPVLVPVVLVLNGLGYVMMMRLEPYQDPAQGGIAHLAGYQAAYSLLGIAAYCITLMVIRRSRDLERYRYVILLVSFALLVTPLLPRIGNNAENSGGVKLWVKLGPISFQPVEISKILLVVFFASYFVEKRELLSISTHRVGNHLLPDLRPFGPIAFAGVCSMLVILLEKDIGFSLLLFFTFLAMLWVATGRWTYLVIGTIVFVVGTYLAARILPIVNGRIDIWLDPWKYLNPAAPAGQPSGFQPVLGELGLAKGGISGTGFGLGAPWLIPVSESDYVFAAIGEELGLIGAAAFVVGFALIVGSGLRAALRARSEFSKMVALGLTAILGFQTFIIMAGNVRLLPDTGITLPFVSYGGSSLIANYILIALLMRISDEGSETRRLAHAREKEDKARTGRARHPATASTPAVASPTSA